MNEPSNYVAKKQILAIADMKIFRQNAYYIKSTWRIKWKLILFSHK